MEGMMPTTSSEPCIGEDFGGEEPIKAGLIQRSV